MFHIKSLIHLELVFVQDIRYESNFILCVDIQFCWYLLAFAEDAFFSPVYVFDIFVNTGWL